VDSWEQIRRYQQPNFNFTKYLRAQSKDQIQSAFLFEQLVDDHLRINVTSRSSKKPIHQMVLPRPATRWGEKVS